LANQRPKANKNSIITTDHVSPAIRIDELSNVVKSNSIICLLLRTCHKASQERLNLKSFKKEFPTKLSPEPDNARNSNPKLTKLSAPYTISGALK